MKRRVSKRYLFFIAIVLVSEYNEYVKSKTVVRQ